jgi:hypothetical protein
MKNGRRQPQAAIAASPSTLLTRAPTPDQAAPVHRRLLDQQDGRSAVLAGHRDALQTAQQEQQDGGTGAQLGMARQHGDAQGGAAHHHHRQDQGGLAADAIAEMTEQHAAQRPREVSRGHRPVGRQQRGDGIVGGEEHLADDWRQEGVDGEVVPFEDVADRTGVDLPVLEALAQQRIPHDWFPVPWRDSASDQLACISHATRKETATDEHG